MIVRIANGFPTFGESQMLHIERCELEIARMRELLRASLTREGVEDDRIAAIIDAGGFAGDGKINIPKTRDPTN